MKIGDKLYCHTGYVYPDTGECWISAEKTYPIVDIKPGYLTILDNQGSKNDFSIIKKGYHIDDFFYTMKEYRKLKIQKINESNLH
jgi:hypothetical protein